jgi:chaperone LolA
MIRSALLTLLAGFTVVSAARAEITPEEVLTNVRKKYDSMEDGELTFTQRSRFVVAKIEQEVSGKLWFKKERKYRVEIGDQTVVTDGETVWSYTPSTGQVLVDHFKLDERSLTPERILTTAPSEYTPALLGREKIGKQETLLLKLTPKKEHSMVQSMKAWVSENDWMIRRVDIVDTSGKETSYIVHTFKVNGGIPDSRFAFEAPEGAETVDLR